MHTAYGIAYALAAVISVAIAVAAWRRRPAPGALGLALLCAGQTWWSASYALQLMLSGDGPSRFWFLVRMIGLQSTPTAILVLALEYTGASRRLTRRNTALLLFEPLFMYAVVLTEPWHNLYLGGHAPAFTQALGGPGWWLNIAYSYALIIVAAILLATRFVKRRAYRLQTAVLFAAVMLPVVQFLMQVVGIKLLPELNTVPFTYALTGVVLWFGLTRLGLLKVVPIARDRLVEQMSEGVIVFDSDRHIADINPAAIRMTQAPTNCLGKTADEAFPGFAHAIAELREGLDRDGKRAVTRTPFPPDGIMEVTSTAVGSGGDERFATLVMLHDITEQTRAAEELDRQREQLAATLERSSVILEAMTDGVLLVDAEGIVQQANPSAARILQTRSDEFQGTDLDTVLADLGVRSLIEQAETTAGPVAVSAVLPSGRTLTVEVISLRASEPDGVRALLVIRDDTERHAAERMQRDFIANAAHELQTPLTGLSLLAETIPRALRDDPERAQGFIHRLSLEIQRLVLMTNELMTMSRLDRQAAADTHDEVDFTRLVQDEIAEIQPVTQSKGQSVSIDIAPNVAVIGDEADLASAVGNLLENAVRYTDSGGNIDVRLTTDMATENTRWAVLVVSDNGIGIPADEQQRVFERFYRADRARSRELGGAGLGLSIVRRTVEQHGGTVSVRSKLGEGSTFTMRLPLAQLP